MAIILLNLANSFIHYQLVEKIAILLYAKALYLIALLLRIYRILVVVRLALDYIPFIKFYYEPWLTLERIVTPVYKVVNKCLRFFKIGKNYRIRVGGWILLLTIDALEGILENQGITLYARARNL